MIKALIRVCRLFLDQTGQEKVLREYSPEKYYERLMAVYEKAMNSAQVGRIISLNLFLAKGVTHMNRRLLMVLIVLISLTLECTFVLASNYGASYIAKWQNNADAALSLTFDDNRATHNAAAAILEEFGVHGTFNPITSYMNEEMFLDIFHRGHELGSHSVNHPHLKGASMEMIIYELTESKLAIEDLTGVPCVSYTAPYGDINDDIVTVAREMYLSARGVKRGINAVANADIFDLQIGPVPPYYDDPNTDWSNEEYCEKMREYLEQVIAAEGWGIQMFNGCTSRAEWNSGSQITDTALRAYLSEITTDFASTIWIAPQGAVARYYLERQETAIEILAVTEDVILLNLLFDGDEDIFDEPLTVATVVPEHWLNGELTVMQNGRRLDLDYTIDVDSDKPCLLYEAIPDGGTISIVFEPNRGGLDYGVSYLAKWKNNADAALSLTFDDNGKKDNRNSAAAILEEYGIHGTFNPITSYMNEEMFLDIFHRGHELGSHSVYHSLLIVASMETIIYELTKSKQAIENLTASPCVSYTAPYGNTGHDIDIVAREIYLSARGIRKGINAIADANIFDLQIGPVPPYNDDPKTNWSNEEYYGKMREYLEQVIAAKGWGIQMFHGWTSRAEWNSGSLITDTALHNYLSEITTNLASTVWVAPQGVIARYYLEWQETTIEMLAVTEDAILLNLLFDSDKAVFNEPLTVVTVVPEHWLSGELAVMQRGVLLDYYVEQHETEARLVYDAMPGGGVVAILFEPTYNQR